MITEVIMLALGETMNEARIVRWLKREGDRVAKGEPIAEIETDKANIEMESLASGVLRKIVESEGAVAPVGRVIAYLAESMDEPLPSEISLNASASPTGRGGAARPAEPSTSPRSTQDASGNDSRAQRPDRWIASPRARRLADREKIDIAWLAGMGTGPRGRIVEADVKNFLRQRRPAPAVPSVPPVPSLPTAPTGDTVIPLAGIRKAIAERMARSAQTAPHMTFDAEVDMSAAEAWRAKANALRKAKGQSSISPTALVVKVGAWALARHPWMNAALTGESITLRGEVNIGVAIALDEGLIVPVIHGAVRKGAAQIADEIADLSERAKTNRLRGSDLAGGTFTVSNLGMFGVDRFTAILNPPETGILAVGRIVKRFVPDENDRPVAKPMMTITLSADHRVVDGATAARFLADVRAGLEDPAMLIL